MKLKMINNSTKFLRSPNTRNLSNFMNLNKAPSIYVPLKPQNILEYNSLSNLKQIFQQILYKLKYFWANNRAISA